MQTNHRKKGQLWKQMEGITAGKSKERTKNYLRTHPYIVKAQYDY